MFFAALALLLVLASAPLAASPPPRGWQLVDLWSVKPIVVRGDPAAFAPMLAPQGADLPRPPAANAAQGGAILTAPRVRALRQKPSTLSWRLRLGAEPYLSFTPLADTNHCPATATVYVGAPGASATSAWTATSAMTPWPAGPEVTVDLAAWAGREVELQLDVHRHKNGGRECAMVWGSPAVASRTVPQAPRRGPKAPPNVLLIGVDTLRADALGAWGRSPSVTPALDALAAESDVWLDAFSTSNATNPSFASIHTGLYVKHHGVRDLETTLPASFTTLAERLTAAGFDTHAVLAAQHLNPERSGLGQGFASVDEAHDTSAARLAVDQAIAWLSLPRQQPFFLWLHLFDPHTPHLPPAPFALGQRAATMIGLSAPRAWTPFRPIGPRAFRNPELAADRDLYLGEVAYVDREIDRLLGLLRSRGQLGDTLVAFVADHGENLEDHGVSFRHAGLWDTTTHVPLMIRWPDREASRAPGASGSGRRLSGLVQTLDLFPTLLAATGAAPSPGDGRDLRALIGSGRTGRPATFAEQADGQGAAVRTSGWRYFVSVASKIVPAGIYLYDHARDPQELDNVAGKGRKKEAELRAMLAQWLRGARASAPKKQLTPEEEAALRALGYD